MQARRTRSSEPASCTEVAARGRSAGAQGAWRGARHRGAEREHGAWLGTGAALGGTGRHGSCEADRAHEVVYRPRGSCS